MWFFFAPPSRSDWIYVCYIQLPYRSQTPHFLVRYASSTTFNSWFPHWQILWYLRDYCEIKKDFLTPSRMPSLCSSCHRLAKCHCSSRHDITSTFPRRKPTGAAQSKEIVVLTREFNHMSQSHLRSLDERSTISSSDGGCCGKTKPIVTWEFTERGCFSETPCFTR